MMVCRVYVQFEKIEAINDEESFVLLTDVHSLTSCPLKILSSHLLLVRTYVNTELSAILSSLLSPVWVPGL